MPAPRPSESAEAARAAALQAEFNEKKWVWVPDEKEGYLAGWVNKEEDEIGDIVMAAGGEVRFGAWSWIAELLTNDRGLGRSGEYRYTPCPR
jgi:hypothetical protein